ARIIQERIQISRARGNAKQSAPNAESRQAIIDFRLRQDALRLGHLNNISESGFVPSTCLLLGGARCVKLDDRVLRDSTRCREDGAGLLHLAVQILHYLVVPRNFGPLVKSFNALPLTDGGKVKERECYRHSKPP